MHCRVTSGAKARTLRQTAGVARLSYNREIDLSVTAQAKIAVARDEHLFVNGAMYLVASRASLADGLMLPHKRTPLVFVTFEAGLIDILKRRR